MGDRCYFEMTVGEAGLRKALADEDNDLEHLSYLVDCAEEPVNGWINVIDEAANYGNIELIEMAASACLTFRGFAGSGDSYDATRFTCLRGSLREVVTGTEGDGYLVAFDDSGPLRGDVAGVLEFRKLDTKVLKLINAGPLEMLGAAHEEE
jgi:hypothetical protein